MIGATLSRIQSPDVVASALIIDLLVVLPGLFYFVFVRGRKWRAVSIVPVFHGCFAIASAVIPAAHRAPLDAIGIALPVLELGLITYVVSRTVRMVRTARRNGAGSGDFHDPVRHILSGVMGSPLAVSALSFEISLFYHAFSFRRPGVAPGEFRYDRSTGYGAVFGAILMIAVAELAAGHILLRMWSETAAFIHLALSCYGVLWIFGDFRAMHRRSHVVTPEGIRIRLGLRWDVDVKWEDVVAIRRSSRVARESGQLNTAALGEATYEFELCEPVLVIGPYGVKRSVTRIGIVVDDRAAFEECLRRNGMGLGKRLD